MRKKRRDRHNIPRFEKRQQDERTKGEKKTQNNEPINKSDSQRQQSVPERKWTRILFFYKKLKHIVISMPGF